MISSKLRTPYERLRSYDILPEIALFKAIIIQAMTDACNAGKHRKDKANKIKATAWFVGNSADFKEVCQNANLDPKLIARVAKELIRDDIAQSKKRSHHRINYDNKFGKNEYHKEDIEYMINGEQTKMSII